MKHLIKPKGSLEIVDKETSRVRMVIQRRHVYAYVKGLKHNLITNSHMCDKDNKVKFRKNVGIIYYPDGKHVLFKIEKGIYMIYLLDLILAYPTKETCLYSKIAGYGI